MHTKFENTGSNKAKKSVTEIFIEEKEKWTNRGTDKQYVAVFFVTQCNSSLSSFVPNFKSLTQVVAEKSLTEKNVHVYYIRVAEEKNEKKMKKEGKMRISILIFIYTGSNRNWEICDSNFHWWERKK